MKLSAKNIFIMVGTFILGISTVSIITTPSFEEIYKPLDTKSVDYLVNQSNKSNTQELEDLVIKEVESSMYNQVDVDTLNEQWLELTLSSIDPSEISISNYTYLEESMVELSEQIEDILGYDTVILDSNDEMVMYIADGYIVDNIR